MKEFNIKITDTDVYVNGELRYFDYPMDKESKEDDLNKKAILALVNEMGYEAQFLFEEMADRLSEMCDEIHDDNDFLQDLADEAVMEETIDIWIGQLLESTGKSSVNELTIEEIYKEKDDVEGAIRNEEITIGLPNSFAEENIRTLARYLSMLDNMIENKEE